MAKAHCKQEALPFNFSFEFSFESFLEDTLLVTDFPATQETQLICLTFTTLRSSLSLPLRAGFLFVQSNFGNWGREGKDLLLS